MIQCQGGRRPSRRSQVLAHATLSIVSHGHGELVDQLLSDLSRQTFAPGIRVVVTLNIPEASFDPQAHEGLAVTVIRNASPQGFGANHNAALKDSDTPWLVVLNPDIRLHDETALERLLTRHANDAVGILAPRIANSDGGIEDSVRHNLTPISLLGRRMSGSRAAIDPSTANRKFCWAAGMFLVIPLESWRAVGGFDQRFFLYCEDYDLCARVALHGKPILFDQAVTVIHDAQRTSHRSLRYMAWHLASLFKVWTSAPFWKIVASDSRIRRRQTLRR